MGIELSPAYAANLAANIYDVKSAITREDFVDEYKNDMELSLASFASGVTGGFILNKPHVMAVFSSGKGKTRDKLLLSSREQQVFMMRSLTLTRESVLVIREPVFTRDSITLSNQFIKS